MINTTIVTCLAPSRDLLCPNQGRRSSSEPRGGDPIQMIGAEVVADTFLKQLITYLEYRQSRVVNAMDDLVNVVNGVVVDASVYAFTAQTVTLVFASLSIFSANLFYLQSLTKVAHFSLLQCALVPSVLCELTLPTVATPPLPEPSLRLCWLPGRVEAIIWECLFLKSVGTKSSYNSNPSDDPKWEDSRAIYVEVTAASPFKYFITHFLANLLGHMKSEQRWRLDSKCSTATRRMRKCFA